MNNWYELYKDAGHGYKRTDIKSLKRSLTYYDIGHGSQDTPTLWTIDDDGDLQVDVSDPEYDQGNQLYHGDKFDGVRVKYQGRFVYDKNLGYICSATLSDGDFDSENTYVDANWVNRVLREKFGSNVKVYWL